MKIIYTQTDEAPALATQSLLPIIRGVRGRRRGRGRAARHLAGRPHPGPVSRAPDRGAAGRRRPRRARGAGHHARGQHHQAAQHQRLGAAAQGGHRRAPGPGLRDPRLPGRAGRRGAARDPRALRPGQGQRGQPGAAPGQLRPPRAGLGQGLRPPSSALDGGVVLGLALARVDHERGGLPLHRGVGHGRPRGLGPDRARRRRRQRHRAQGATRPCWRARCSTPR